MKDMKTMKDSSTKLPRRSTNSRLKSIHGPCLLPVSLSKQAQLLVFPGANGKTQILLHALHGLHGGPFPPNPK